MTKGLSESKKSVFIILLVFLLTNFLIRGPDLFKYLNKPSNKWYTGQTSWFDPWDHNVYFSAIGWGKRDGLLYANLYDTTADQSLFIYTLYTSIGKIFSWSNYSNVFIFHLAGIIFSFILLAVVWWFIGLFLKEIWQKLFSFLIISIGGGLGWLLFPQVQTPDVSQPGFILESALRRPHEAISSSLFLLSVGNFWIWGKTKKNKYLVFTFISSFFMSFFHPYSLLTMGAVILVFVSYKFLQTKKINLFLGLSCVVGSGIIWYLIIGRTLVGNPSFSGLLSQVQASPTPLMVVLGWGIIFPLTVVGLVSKSTDDEINFLKIWFSVGWLIIYLPFGFQRLLIRGLWIPTVLLATYGIKKISKGKIYLLIKLSGIILVFVSFSLIYTAAKRVTETETNRWIYLTKEEGEIINYLNQHGDNEEGVLASYRIANIIPAVTKKRVWAGHNFQTPQFKIRINEVNKFFSGLLEEKEARAFVNKTKTVWVFFGPDEQLVNKTNGIKYRFLKPVVNKDNVTLYKTTASL